MNRLQKPKTNYTVIPNEIFDLTDLSADSRFMYVYFLSRPENWEVRIKNVQARMKCGREKVYRMLRELREHDLLSYQALIEGGGVYTLHEITVSQKAVCGKPASGKPSRLINTERAVNTERAKSIYTDDFERWWSVYPNKTGKKPAFAIWKRTNPPVDLLIQHTSQSALSDRRWLPDEKGKTYIPNPTTYLNQERWNDEIQRATPTETGFERTARMAHEYLADQGGNGYHDGQALDMDGRALPPPMD